MGHHEKKREKSEKSSKKDKHHTKDKKHHKKDKKHSDKKERRSSSHEKTDNIVNDGIAFLSPDDFFLKSEEFRCWLRLFQQKNFEDLSTVEAHELFENDFVKLWNRRKLPSMFFDKNGIPAEVREQAMKTTHQWGFKLTDREAQQKEQIVHEVDRKTRTNTEGAWVHMAQPCAASALPSSSSSSSSRNGNSSSSVGGSRVQGPALGPGPGLATRPMQSGAGSGSGTGISDRPSHHHPSTSSSSQSQSHSHSQSHQQSKDRQREYASECVDAASSSSSRGREAVMQKRQTAGQSIHAAARYCPVHLSPPDCLSAILLACW